jgi:hypothetical protein
MACNAHKGEKHRPLARFYTSFTMKNPLKKRVFKLIDDTISILDDLESRTLSIEQIAEKYNVDLRFIERLSKSLDKG